MLYGSDNVDKCFSYKNFLIVEYQIWIVQKLGYLFSHSLRNSCTSCLDRRRFCLFFL